MSNLTTKPTDFKPYTIEFDTDSQKHNKGKQIFIEDAHITIGRLSECKIQFGDDMSAVSRKHASIRYEDGKYILKHEAEGNKTLVNGKLITNQYILSDKDRIQLSENGPKIVILAPNAQGSNDPDTPIGTKQFNDALSTNQAQPQSTKQVTTIGTMAVNEPNHAVMTPYAIEFKSQITGHYINERKHISAIEAFIGRDDKCLIKFDKHESNISGIHAAIQYRNGSYYLVHKSAMNPTFVNKKQVSTEQILKNGDVLNLSYVDKYELMFIGSGSAFAPLSGTAPVPIGDRTSIGTNRVREIISQNTDMLKKAVIGLSAVIVGLIGWNVYQKKQTDTAINTATNSAIAAANTAAKAGIILPFPEEELEKHVFFADGYINLEVGGLVLKQEKISGSSFLDNKGNLITARHVVRPMDYDLACDMLILKARGDIQVKLSFDFYSPKINEKVISPIFTVANVEPRHPMNLSKCPGAKTCSPNEDWAVSKAPELSKIKSEIEVDRDFAKNIKNGTELYVLGYKNGKSAEPQAKKVSLALLEPSSMDGAGAQPVFKVNEPDFGPGDSGAPVFAYNTAKQKWVVIGIVHGGEGDRNTNHQWGVILPMNIIPSNNLD